MEQNFQTSFIPKKPVVKETAISSRQVSPFLVISLFVLFFVVAVTIGLYFYDSIVKKNIANLQNSLTLAEQRFEPAKIAELQTLDKRLHASSEILAQHTAVSPVFQALEDLTLKTVRYTKFQYSFDPDQKMATVKISGMAIGYRSVALQADLFTQNKNIQNPVFSNLTLDQSGNVLFDLVFSVDPSFINYKQMITTAAQN